jgi:hypothetical protein
MPIFLWDVESSANYTEKLILAEIGTITLALDLKWIVDFVWKSALGFVLDCYEGGETFLKWNMFSSKNRKGETKREPLGWEKANFVNDSYMEVGDFVGGAVTGSFEKRTWRNCQKWKIWNFAYGVALGVTYYGRNGCKNGRVRSSP